MTVSLDRSIADLRALSTTLSSQRRQLTDLEAVLHRATLALGFEPETCVEVDLGDLSAEVAGALMPVVNEALSNVARHARATRVLVSLTQDSDDLLLTVRDDGIGMPLRRPGAAALTTSPAALRTSAARVDGRPRTAAERSWNGGYRSVQDPPLKADIPPDRVRALPPAGRSGSVTALSATSTRPT